MKPLTIVSERLISKVIIFKAISSGASSDWEETIATVIRVNAVERELHVIVKSTPKHKSYIGKETGWPLSDCWGYIFPQTDWD